MKCEVIQDLLPLYSENLCSKESNELINEHLGSCETCRNFLDNLTKDNLTEEIDTSQIEDYLKEKDLLSHSKKAMKFEGTKKVLSIIFYIISILNVLFIVLLSGSVLLGYYIKYPQFYIKELGATSFVLAIFILLPLIISIFGIFIAKRKVYKKRYQRLLILTSVLLIPAIFFSIFGGLITFAIPPIRSYTQNIENYLQMDDELDQYQKTIVAFFPEKVPNNAYDIQYSYAKYSSLFHDSLEIKASWNLPEEDYLYMVNQIDELEFTEKIEGGNNLYHIYLAGIPYPKNLKTYIEYDDAQHRITYTLSKQ